MRIVVGVDGTDQQADAVALAATLCDDAADVVVVHVYPWYRSMFEISEDYERVVRQDAEALVEAPTAMLAGARPRIVGEQTPARGLVHVALEEKADLIVIASSHRSRIGHALLGGVAERLLHDAPCPVAVAPLRYSSDERDLGRIAVAFDGGAESQAAARWAADLAVRSGATVDLVTVLQPPHIAAYPNAAAAYVELFESQRHAQQHLLERAIAEMPAEVGASGEMREGSAASCLVEASTDRDLMVMGSRGYGRVGRVLLGGVARSVLQEAHCPVVVIARSAMDDSVSESASDSLTAR